MSAPANRRAGEPALRAWRAEDSDVVRRHLAESPDLARQLPPADEIDAWCARSLGEDGRWAFAICLDDVPVGNVAVAMRDMRVGWCSYWIAGPYRGRHLASWALQRLCEHAFTELDAFRLELAHRVNNPASGAVAARAGFLPEGVMRAELEYDGVRYDTRLWSRLATDPPPPRGTKVPTQGSPPDAPRT